MNKKQSGFTIVELMIGVAILGVLSAIAISSFTNFLNKSKASEAVSMTTQYKSSVVNCATNGSSLSNCDNANSNVLASSDGKYGRVKVNNGQVIYEFNIASEQFKNHSVTFYIKDFNEYNPIQWSCQVSNGFEIELLPSALNCEEQEAISEKNIFNNIDDVRNFFNGDPIINGEKTNANYFVGDDSNKVAYLTAEQAKEKCNSLYKCGDPYGNYDYELSKADGTKISNLDQFCKEGYTGMIANAWSSGSGAGLVCVKK